MSGMVTQQFTQSKEHILRMTEDGSAASVSYGGFD